MMLPGFFFLLLLKGGSTSDNNPPLDGLEDENTSVSEASEEINSNSSVTAYYLGTNGPDYDNETTTGQPTTEDENPPQNFWQYDNYDFFDHLLEEDDRLHMPEGPMGPMAPMAPPVPGGPPSCCPPDCGPPAASNDAGYSRCSHIFLINHFNLTDKIKFAMTRPVRSHTEPTTVLINPSLQAILDVKEKEQKFVAFILLRTVWENKLISWRPQDFCHISVITIPAELMWRPDVTIVEMTEKTNAFKSHFVNINYKGLVSIRSGMVMACTCRMQFFKFPLDRHSCNLTFMSIGHFASSLTLSDGGNVTLESIRKDMQTEAEWQLVGLKVESKIVENFGNKSVLIYTITIKRSSVLYVINFILPILFFLCLDMASFLMTDSGGEKLSFKVTVLLAVTVMQLVLNDILPSSSGKTPIIVIYCIGVFSLMLMSVLETILVMYLMNKDSQDKEAEEIKQSQSDDFMAKQGRLTKCLREINGLVRCSCVLDMPASKKDPTFLPTQEGSSSQLTKDAQEKIEDHLRVLVDLLLSNRKQEEKPGYWARTTKTINKVYYSFYVTIATVFLSVVFSFWFDDAMD